MTAVCCRKLNELSLSLVHSVALACLAACSSSKSIFCYIGAPGLQPVLLVWRRVWGTIIYLVN